MKSVRIDSVPLIAGACVVGVSGLGVLARDVPATGPDGPAFGWNDLETVDADQEVRWLILTRPEEGTLTMQEDSSGRFDGAPANTTQHFYLRPFIDGKPRPDKLVAVTIGAQRTPTGLTLSLT